MIIVSQDKENIINFERADLINVYKAEKKQVVAWFSCNESENNNVLLGVYATEERAKEVLQELVKTYSSYLTLNGGPALIQGQTDIAPAIFNIPKVYEMPEK